MKENFGKQVEVEYGWQTGDMHANKREIERNKI